jgi:hypothetical protein
MLIFRNGNNSLTSAIDKATSQSGSFLESFIENTFRFFWNRKKTTYQEISKNSFEYGAGWTYSNGHPLSADPSQIIWRIDPDEFNIFYENYGGAMTIGKVSEIPTTTWYTDHKFNNNKFFHDYSTGDVFVNDGSLTLFGSNENINLSAANTGIRILNGNITSLLGSVHLSSGDIRLNGLNKGITISSLNGYVVTPILSTVLLTATDITQSGTHTKRPVDLGTYSIDQNLTINVPCGSSDYFYVRFTGTTGITLYTKTFNLQNVPLNCYQIELEIASSDDTNLQWPSGALWRNNSPFSTTSSAQRTYLVTLKTRDGGSNWLACYDVFY